MALLKVFFGCAVRGNRSEETVKLFKSILDELENSIPIEVIGKHNFIGIAGETKMTDREIWDRDLAEWQAADCGILEVSYSSFGVGFEACYLQFVRNIPLLLIHESVKKVPSAMIRGNPGVNVMVITKYNKANLRRIISGFVTTVIEMKDEI